MSATTTFAYPPGRFIAIDGGYSADKFAPRLIAAHAPTVANFKNLFGTFANNGLVATGLYARSSVDIVDNTQYPTYVLVGQRVTGIAAGDKSVDVDFFITMFNGYENWGFSGNKGVERNPSFGLKLATWRSVFDAATGISQSPTALVVGKEIKPVGPVTSSDPNQIRQHAVGKVNLPDGVGGEVFVGVLVEYPQHSFFRAPSGPIDYTGTGGYAGVTIEQGDGYSPNGGRAVTSAVPDLPLAPGAYSGKPGNFGDPSRYRPPVNKQELDQVRGGNPWWNGAYVPVAGTDYYWDGTHWQTGRAPNQPIATGVREGAPATFTGPTGFRPPANLTELNAIHPTPSTAWAPTSHAVVGGQKYTWDGHNWVGWTGSSLYVVRGQAVHSATEVHVVRGGKLVKASEVHVVKSGLLKRVL